MRRSIRMLLRWKLVAAGVVALGAGVAQASIVGFGGNGTGWTLNHFSGPDLPTIAADVLTLTNNGLAVFGNGNSGIFDRQQSVSHFTASFTYQATGGGGLGLADGAVFVIENSPAGASAVGDSGGFLGYTGITPSVAVEFNIYGTSGTAYNTGGGVGGYVPTAPVDLRSGRPIKVVLTYDGTTLIEKLTDTVTSDTFNRSYQVDIPTTVGGAAAFVGFTGGTGAGTSIQQISDFVFSNEAPVPVMSSTMLLAMMVVLLLCGRTRLKRRHQ